MAETEHGSESVDELIAEQEKLFKELGIDVTPNPDAFDKAAFEEYWDDLARYYAHYREALPGDQAALAACRTVFDSAGVVGFEEYLEERISVGDGGHNLAAKYMEDLARSLDPAWQLICEIQPRQLELRETLGIVDLAEQWSLDGAAWLAPVGCPSDYWASVASGQILNRAKSAKTRNGRRVKLDQAVYVIRTVGRKHHEANDSQASQFCDRLMVSLEIARG